MILHAMDAEKQTEKVPQQIIINGIECCTQPKSTRAKTSPSSIARTVVVHNGETCFGEVKFNLGRFSHQQQMILVGKFVDYIYD